MYWCFFPGTSQLMLLHHCNRPIMLLWCHSFAASLGVVPRCFSTVIFNHEKMTMSSSKPKLFWLGLSLFCWVLATKMKMVYGLGKNRPIHLFNPFYMCLFCLCLSLRIAMLWHFKKHDWPVAMMDLAQNKLWSSRKKHQHTISDWASHECPHFDTNRC